MNKKLVIVIALALAFAFCLTACSGKTFKQTAVETDTTGATVTSNGGTAVRYGKYVYFVNGYVGLTDIDNTFGTPEKSAIWRVTLDDSGAIIADSAVRIAPKNVVDSSTTPGIYVYDGYVYYATTNTDKDKNGVENTTYLDFYRTTLDGSLTNKIATVDSRSTQYAFLKGYLVYVHENGIYSVSGDGKTETTILEEKLTTARFIACDNGDFDGYILYTRTLPEEIEYESYNQLCAVKPDGSGATTIITGDTFTSDKTDVRNVFTVTMLDYAVESDGLTLFYTKSYTTGGSSTSAGTFCYKFSGNFAFNKAGEKKLSTVALSSIVPISYAEGLLVTENSTVVNYKDGNRTTVIGRSVTARFVKDGYIYYTEASSPAELFRFKLDGSGVEQSVFKTKLYTTGVIFDIVGNYVYFTDTTHNYLYRYNLSGELGKDIELVGKMTQADLDAIAKA